MKKHILFITLITLFFVQIFGKNPDEDIIILYTNDVHCAINETIGYAGLSYYKQEVNKKTPYVSLVDAGDHVQGGTIGTLSSGKYLIDIMNAVVYDVATPGNHEFDYGMKQFQFFSKYLSCGYISCNFRDLRTGQLVFRPYDIQEYGDVKVAFVGVSTPESIVKSTPRSFMDKDGHFIYDFDGDATGEKLINSVQEAVNNARKEGADFVIGIGHLGEHGDNTKEWSALYVVEHTFGIDAFIDGHSHEITERLMQKNLEGKEIPITQSGSRLIKIGQVTIKKDGTIKTELIDASEVKSKDEKILDLISNIQSKFAKKLSKVIGFVDFELQMDDSNGQRIIRKNESNLSDLITDAYLYGSNSYGDAEIAFLNGGSIRSDIKPGNITYETVIEVLPFRTPACLVELSGQSILDGLEMSARKYPDENGGFLHTAGLTYAIDPDIPSSVVLDETTNMFLNVTGERRIHDVRVHGVPIDPQKRYRVIGSMYTLMEHGDGFVFNGLKVINTNFALPSDLLMKYIKKLGSDIKIYRNSQGRLVFSKKGTTTDSKLNSKITLQIKEFNEKEFTLKLKKKVNGKSNFINNHSGYKFKISNNNVKRIKNKKTKNDVFDYNDDDRIIKIQAN